MCFGVAVGFCGIDRVSRWGHRPFRRKKDLGAGTSGMCSVRSTACRAASPGGLKVGAMQKLFFGSWWGPAPPINFLRALNFGRV